METLLHKRKLGLRPEAFLGYARQKVVGVQTGLAQLDSQMLGLRGMVGLVGEPKACKSTLALQTGLQNARTGVPVIFVDAENGESLTSQRAMCNLYQRDWNYMKSQSDEVITKQYSSLQKLPFYYLNGLHDTAELSKYLTQIYEFHNQQKMLLVIDSLQAIVDSIRDIRLSIDEWLSGLDDLKLAYDTKLITLLTIEKRRGCYGSASKDAAKESGRIEYKLEQQLDMRVDPETENIIIQCTENRHGPLGQPVHLTKVMASNDDPFSFIFQLREQENIDL